MSLKANISRELFIELVRWVQVKPHKNITLWLYHYYDCLPILLDDNIGLPPLSSSLSMGMLYSFKKAKEQPGGYDTAHGGEIGAEFLRLNPLQDCRPAYDTILHDITGGQPSLVIHLYNPQLSLLIVR